MKKPNWVCVDCKFLGLIANWGTCSSRPRLDSGAFPGLLPECPETIALTDEHTTCEYKVQGLNGIFDDGGAQGA